MTRLIAPALLLTTCAALVYWLVTATVVAALWLLVLAIAGG